LDKNKTIFLIHIWVCRSGYLLVYVRITNMVSTYLKLGVKIYL
jgi:hypothetical protein